jgi:hypothetical protein
VVEEALWWLMTLTGGWHYAATGLEKDDYPPPPQRSKKGGKSTKPGTILRLNTRCQQHRLFVAIETWPIPIVFSYIQLGLTGQGMHLVLIESEGHAL